MMLKEYENTHPVFVCHEAELTAVTIPSNFRMIPFVHRSRQAAYWRDFEDFCFDLVWFLFNFPVLTFVILSWLVSHSPRSKHFRANSPTKTRQPNGESKTMQPAWQSVHLQAYTPDQVRELQCRNGFFLANKDFGERFLINQSPPALFNFVLLCLFVCLLCLFVCLFAHTGSAL